MVISSPQVRVERQTDEHAVDWPGPHFERSLRRELGLAKMCKNDSRNNLLMCPLLTGYEIVDVSLSTI